MTGTNVKVGVKGMERIAVELFKGRHKFEDIEGCIFNKGTSVIVQMTIYQCIVITVS